MPLLLNPCQTCRMQLTSQYRKLVAAAGVTTAEPTSTAAELTSTAAELTATTAGHSVGEHHYAN